MTMMKTKESLLIHIVTGLAVLGVHAQSIAGQAGDGSSVGKNRGAQSLSTTGIGKTSPGPRDAKAGSVTLIASPSPVVIQNAVPVPIYVNVMPGWGGYGGNFPQPWGNRTSTSNPADGNNTAVGSAGPLTSSLRMGGAPADQWRTAGNASAGGNFAPGQNGWSGSFGGTSGQNLDGLSFGSQSSIGAGRTGVAPRR